MTHYRRDAQAIHDRIQQRVRERTEQESRFRRICCFCKKDMGPAGPGFTGHTHGSCEPPCAEAIAFGWGE